MTARTAPTLPGDVKGRHSEIPWREVQGFRNVAAPAYTGIDLDVVWRIAVEDLPPLARAVDAELRAVEPARQVDG